MDERQHGLNQPGASPSEPIRRLRRLRGSAVLREAVAEVMLLPRHLVCPLFVSAAETPDASPSAQRRREAIPSMSGVFRWSVEAAADEIERLIPLGIDKFLLFGVVPDDCKDDDGRCATRHDAPVNQLLRLVRERDLPALMIADLCCCEYTRHGHCGVLRTQGTGNRKQGTVDNDATLPIYGEIAVALAGAGADVVAPSGMMDGQVAAVRGALDAAEYEGLPILSYSVKFASSLYGPFREAGGCTLGGPRPEGVGLGDRKGYQMDYRRAREWRAELASDLAEGADLVMVKPAAAYLDIVRQVREACDVPLVAYHVSGEYAMLHAAADRGWLDLEPAAIEVTTAIRRAGADWVVSYFAPVMAEWLRRGAGTGDRGSGTRSKLMQG